MSGKSQKILERAMNPGQEAKAMNPMSINVKGLGKNRSENSLLSPAKTLYEKQAMSEGQPNDILVSDIDKNSMKAPVKPEISHKL